MVSTISIIVLAIICFGLIISNENLRADLRFQKHLKEMYHQDSDKYFRNIKYIPIGERHREEILEYHKQGLTGDRIGEIFGIDGSTVNKYLKRWKRESERKGCVKS